MIGVKQGIRLEFAAENQVDFGRGGIFVLKEKAQNTIHKYNLKRYTDKEVCITNLPSGVNTANIISECEFCNGTGGLILQDSSTAATLVLSPDGTELLDSWHHEGILLTCLNGNDPMYAVETTEGEYEIAIVIDNKSETRLQPVTGKPTWSHPYLSVANNLWTELMAVTSATDHSLDIYKYVWGK